MVLLAYASVLVLVLRVNVLVLVLVLRVNVLVLVLVLIVTVLLTTLIKSLPMKRNRLRRRGKTTQANSLAEKNNLMIANVQNSQLRKLANSNSNPKEILAAVRSFTNPPQSKCSGGSSPKILGGARP